MDADMEAAGPSRLRNSIANSFQIPNDFGVDRLLTPIFKLDVDGFEDLFEYLSVADLRSLRQTCKRLLRVVDYFISLNYPAVKFGCRKFQLKSKKDLQEFRQMDPISLKMVKHVIMSYDQITNKEMEEFKDFWQTLKRFEVGTKPKDGDLYDTFLKWCPNLRDLSINQNVFVNEDSGWLRRHYPTIEHFAITNGGFLPGLKTFFKLNGNIRKFSVTELDLAGSFSHFLDSHIKIDVLNITAAKFGINFDYNLLEKLHKQGFYKQFHLHITLFKPTIADFGKIALIHGLEKLILRYKVQELILPPMPELKELLIGPLNRHVDLDTLAQSLISVERVHFIKAKSDQIIPFVRYAPKVKEVKIDELTDGTHFENGIIDISALNKGREGLPGAEKLTIYVDESTFLSTKMVTTKTQFNLVTLKRTQAVEWIHQYNGDFNAIRHDGTNVPQLFQVLSVPILVFQPFRF